VTSVNPCSRLTPMSGRNTTRRSEFFHALRRVSSYTSCLGKRSPEPAEDIISLFDFGSDVEGGPAGEADPEFAPGKYEYDQKPTRKRRKTAAIGASCSTSEDSAWI
jgi:hypothetical protein